MQEAWVWSLGREDPLEKEMATHSSILPGKSHGQRSLVGYSPWGRKDWATEQQWWRWRGEGTQRLQPSDSMSFEMCIQMLQEWSLELGCSCGGSGGQGEGELWGADRGGVTQPCLLPAHPASCVLWAWARLAPSSTSTLALVLHLSPRNPPAPALTSLLLLLQRHLSRPPNQSSPLLVTVFPSILSLIFFAASVITHNYPMWGVVCLLIILLCWYWI